METKELHRILDKGWVVTISRQPLLNSWDVKMAATHYEMSQDNWVQVAGFSRTLDEALLACEKMILSRWDKLHPDLDRKIFGGGNNE